jgi:hypothetical protein
MEESPYPQIDKIRTKFDANEPLSLREAAWVFGRAWFLLDSNLFIC